MESNFSYLTVLGLAVISGQVFAEVNFAGQLRFDTEFNSDKPVAQRDSLILSRARFDASAQLASDWTTTLRLEIP
jgi:hypothetical protein